MCSAPNCGKSLQNCGFVEEKGQRYCSDCYEKYHAHLCGRCHKKIVGVRVCINLYSAVHRGAIQISQGPALLDRLEKQVDSII